MKPNLVKIDRDPNGSLRLRVEGPVALGAVALVAIAVLAITVTYF